MTNDMSEAADRETPVVLCEVVSLGDGDATRWRFWCPFCRTYHHHSPEPGYRVAHCGSHREIDGRLVAWRSPFRGTGYVLRLDERRA